MAENVKKQLIFMENIYIIKLSFSKEIFRKGGLFYMTTSDLIWRLIEILLKDKEKELNAENQKDD